MDEPVEFDRSPDVLYHGVALRHVVELPVLGVPVRFESNSAAAIETVEDAFAMWRALRGSPELIAPQSLRHPIPIPAMIAPAMDQQQRRSVRIAPIDVVKAQTLGNVVPGSRSRHAVEHTHGGIV